jgi:hypothetical protein
MVYVSGNLLLFFEKGNKRRHLAPDVFVVKGVPKQKRLNYLMWEEGKGPDVVIELTSSSTRREDTIKKKGLYQNTLQVPEFFLFDPFGDYLHPALQGYRLRGSAYVPIKPIAGRLPSKVLGLHLEQQGPNVRLFDPVAEDLLPTLSERVTEAEQGREQDRIARQQAEVARERAELARDRAELENRRPKIELADLRRQLEGMT